MGRTKTMRPPQKASTTATTASSSAPIPALRSHGTRSEPNIGRHGASAASRIGTRLTPACSSQRPVRPDDRSPPRVVRVRRRDRCAHASGAAEGHRQKATTTGSSAAPATQAGSYRTTPRASGDARHAFPRARRRSHYVHSAKGGRCGQLPLGRASRCTPPDAHLWGVTPFCWWSVGGPLTSSGVRVGIACARAFRDPVPRGRRAREPVRQGRAESAMDWLCLATRAGRRRGAGWAPSGASDQVPFKGCGTERTSPSSERGTLLGTQCSASLPWVSPASSRWLGSWRWLVRPEFHGLAEARLPTRRKQATYPCLLSRPNLRWD